MGLLENNDLHLFPPRGKNVAEVPMEIPPLARKHSSTLEDDYMHHDYESDDDDIPAQEDDFEVS